MPLNSVFLKQLLHIKKEKNTSDPVIALFEIGDNSAGGIVMSTDHSQLYSAVYFQFDESISKEAILIKLKKDLAIDDFKKKEVKVVFNLSTCTLIPNEFSNSNESFADAISLLYGTNPFSKNMKGNALAIDAVICWRVDAELAEIIEKKLGTDLSKSKHVFQQIKIPMKTGIELTCIVYPDVLRVVLFKNQELLFAGYFAYTEAQDGVYHLLHLLNKYGILPQDVNLILEGLVTQESALYTQLHQYIGNVNCTQETVISVHEAFFDPYPIHYFGHLIVHLS